MPNLYQLSNEMIMVEAQVLAEGGVMTDEEKGILDGLQMEAEEKIEACVMMMRNLLAEADQEKGMAAPFLKEAQFYLDRAKVKANKAAAIKKYVQSFLEDRHVDQQQAGPFKVSLQNNSRPSLEVVEADQVPEFFIKVVKSFDNGKAWEHTKKTGEEVPGVRYIYGRHLRIR